MATYTYTPIADYILDDLLGFASINAIKNNIRYLAEDVLGDPSANSDKPSSAAANNFRDQTTRPVSASPGQGGVAKSANVTSFTDSSGSMVDVTGVTVTLVTSGRPVFVGITNDGTSVSEWKVSETSSGTQVDAAARIVRDSTTIYTASLLATVSGNGTNPLQIAVPPSGIWTIDNVAAGTYVYKLQGQVVLGDNFNFNDISMFAFEL